jgi:chromosome segregation ATPase
MVQRQFDGRLKLDHKNKKLTMEVKKNDGDLASQACKLSMLSGGERSYTQSAFLLALWKAIECPFRVLDEFDVFMDKVNRVTTLHNLQRMALEEKANNQFIFITPVDLSSIKADQVKVCVWKMIPPREDRHTSANQTTLVLK